LRERVGEYGFVLPKVKTPELEFFYKKAKS
jgi:hypothetical protein